ncbi:MAG: phosphate regulon transcriptional regulator PhoB [Pseudomonadota bacterium]
MKAHILVVEDEPALVELLRYNLEKEDFRVSAAADGEEALAALAVDKPDLVILDWMLPLVSGLEVCRQLRRKPDTSGLPVIMLTALGEEADRMRGFAVGADDYLAKPFSPRELVARVHAVLRRARPAVAGQSLSYAGMVVDPMERRVVRNGRPVHLGPTEFRLLVVLIERPGRVLSREQLLDAVWGREAEVEERTVDAHIARLRRALNGPGEADLIRTVRAAGYALDARGP